MRRAVGLLSAVSASTLLAWSAGSVNAAATRAGITQIPLFPDTMTAQEWDQVQHSEWFNGNFTDFSVAPTVWSGVGAQAASGNAASATVAYSFPKDGTSWKLGATTAPNALNAALKAAYGNNNLDQGREFIRQSIAAWKAGSGVIFKESADDNSAFDTATAHSTARGDVRIGGIPVGTGANPVAASNLPSLGGDIALNTSFFIPANFTNPANNYRYLRNAFGHEMGTALGLNNVVPCDGTKLMEGQVNTTFDGPRIDDLRGIQRCYGDRFSGNNDPATAHSYGNISVPTTPVNLTRSIRERNMSTNGNLGANGTKEDWYRFQYTINFQDLVITVTPTGGTYMNGAQSGGACAGSTTSVNASQAGNLTIELRDSAGAAFAIPVIASGGAGNPSVLNLIHQAPAIYTLRVVDNGPNPAGNQTVQSYDLSIIVNTASFKSQPIANAGVDKRVESGTTCFYMGDINSFATEPGATITAYDWDLDGNGSFETLNNPRPTTTYTSDQVVPVTLRITDSNGKQATDTINVTVFGSVTGMAWRSAPNAVNPRTGTNPSTDPQGGTWNSGGPWKTFDLVVEGHTGALLNGVNLGADGSANGVVVAGTVYNHPFGSNSRSFALETTFAAVFFDTYACYGGTNTTDGAMTNFAGGANNDLTGNSGILKVTTFAQPPVALVADAAAPGGGSLRVLRASVHGTLGGGASQVELGLPGGATRIYSIPTALAPCPGDTDGDGDIDFIDLNRVLSAFGTSVGNPNYIPGADLDGDGDVDFIDLNTCLSFFGTSCAMAGPMGGENDKSVLIGETYFAVGEGPFCNGDVDRDGRVSFVDLNAVLSSFGASATYASPADLNHDGIVDVADLHEVISHFGAVN